MRKKPKIVFIGGVKHKVFSSDEISGPRRRGMRILGQYRPISGEILYKTRLGVEKNITITHEILHAVDHQFDIGLPEITVDIISREIVGAMSQLGMLRH